MTELFLAPEVIAERFERLVAVVERSALAKHRAREGRTEVALVEGPSRRDPAITSAKTGQGKLVHFSSAEPASRVPGAFVEVAVTRGAPHHLEGDFVSLLDASRTPRRLELRAG